MRERQLLDRNDEIGRIQSVIDRARSREGGALFVVGPPGIGKSRLLDEAAQLGDAAGMRVLEAQAHPLEHDFAFAVVRQLFDAIVHSGGGSELLRGPAEPAAALFAHGTAVPDGSDDGLYPLLHGLFWLAAHAADDQPLLLVLDDVQWADVASLRFLAYVVHRLAELPIAVVVALRPDDEAPTGELLEELGSHRSIDVLEPRPLRSSGVEQLVRAALTDATSAFCEACRAATGGNPFLVVELLRALPPSFTGSDADVEHVARLAPRTIARSVLARLARLPDIDTDVARAVSVLSGSVDLALVAAVAGCSLDDAAGAVDDLVRADVLEREGGDVRFIHSVVAQSVLGDVSPGQRAELDFRAAATLHQRGQAPAQVAAHLLETAGRGNCWAVEALVTAARRALGEGVPETALRYLRRAAAEGCGEADLQATVLFELGGAEAMLGEPESAAHLEAAAAASHDDERRANALALAARAHLLAGRGSEARRCYDRAAEVGTGEQAATMRAEVAAAGTVEPACSGSVDLAADPDSLAPSGPAERLQLTRAAVERFWAVGSTEQAVDYARGATGAGRLLRDAAADGLGVYLLANVFGWSGAFDDAVALLDAAAADARLRGATVALATASYCRGWVLLRAGRLREARIDIDAALDARSRGWDLFAGGAVATSVWHHLTRGDLAAATATLTDDGRDLARGDVVSTLYLEAARGDVAMAANDPATALRRYHEAGQICERAGIENPAVFPWRSRAAHALHALGNTAEAAELAREELALAGQSRVPRAVAVARLALAPTLAPADALAEAEAAAATLTDSSTTLVHLDALVAQGAALRELGQRDEAAERLRGALDLAERLGALGAASAARAELQAAGFRPRRGARMGVGALTPSERRVAERAAAGLSNREIAEELFVTVKTVEFHLGNAFTKCEVTSRGELTALLGPAGAQAPAATNGATGKGSTLTPPPAQVDASPHPADTGTG